MVNIKHHCICSTYVQAMLKHVISNTKSKIEITNFCRRTMQWTKINNTNNYNFDWVNKQKCLWSQYTFAFAANANKCRLFNLLLASVNWMHENPDARTLECHHNIKARYWKRYKYFGVAHFSLVMLYIAWISCANVSHMECVSYCHHDIQQGNADWSEWMKWNVRWIAADCEWYPFCFHLEMSANEMGI